MSALDRSHTSRKAHSGRARREKNAARRMKSGWRLETGGWRLEAGVRRFEAGGWRKRFPITSAAPVALCETAAALTVVAGRMATPRMSLPRTAAVWAGVAGSKVAPHSGSQLGTGSLLIEAEKSSGVCGGRGDGFIFASSSRRTPRPTRRGLRRQQSGSGEYGFRIRAAAVWLRWAGARPNPFSAWAAE